MKPFPGRDRSWLAVAALATVGATAAGLLATAGTAAAATPQPIGSAPVVPHGAVRTGAVAGTRPLHLSVQLAPRDPAALAEFVRSVSDPHSANYKHYLAAGEFGPAFGASPATIEAVTDQLRAAGLDPGPVAENDLSIPVTATAAQAESAFGVGISTYRLPSGRVGYANTTAPKLPAAVAASVQGVLGLNSLVEEAPHVQPSGKSARVAKPSVAPGPHSSGPVMCSEIQDFVNANPDIYGQDTQGYWLPQTLSAAGAYNTQQLYGGYGNTGAGVTVAVFELEKFIPADISFYQQCFGTHVPVSTVVVDNGPADPADANTGLGRESAIDIEAVLGMAPGASIVVYQGPDPDNGESDATIEDTYQRIVNDDRAQVISTSWGLCEAESDLSLITAEGTTFAQAAAQGQSVVAASGDSGSTDCFRPGLPGPDDATLTVDDPASQPLVTAAGGTTMQGLGPQTLTTWNSPEDANFFAGAGGGGVSAVHQLSGAADYQQGVSGAGYSNACQAPDGSFCRQVPDVAALADPHEGFLTLWGTDTADGSILVEPDGGTSLAAPLVASMLALADASTACAANGPAGFVNPQLYTHPGATKDVTTGNNDVTASGFTGGLYPAGTGYDLATGLGSVQAPQLVEAVCDTPAGAGSAFVPTSPTRVLDTRNRIGVPGTTPIGANSSIKLQLTGAHGVPATGVTAVVLNVTATAPTVGGVFTVWPDGKPRPASSNLNFTKGETIANLVTVPVGADGAVRIFNLAGTTHAVADLEGYYTSTDPGSLYDPVTPVRVLDTRNAIGVPTRTPIGTGSFVKLQVAGTHGVPATGVTSVVLNVTATAGTAGGFFTVYPDGTTRPTASNLNFTKNETIPNLVTVAVGADGAVDVFNLAGTTHAVADLEGYYTNTGSGLKFHPSTPHRMVDTRNGTGVAAGQQTPIGANGTFGLPLTDTNGVGNAGPLATSGALALNVTVTAPTVGGVLTVYPSGVAKPVTSNLNFTKGETIPNAVLTPVRGTSINFTNLAGTTQMVVDVFGYFSTN